MNKKNIERRLEHNAVDYDTVMFKVERPTTEKLIQKAIHKEKMSRRRANQRARLPFWSLALLACFGPPTRLNPDFKENFVAKEPISKSI